MKSIAPHRKVKDKKLNLSGIVPPLVTPFNEQGEIEYELFRKEVNKMVRMGVRGISVGGSTGEGATLSDQELVNLVKIAKEEVQNEVTLVCGIITDSTYQSVKRGLLVKDLGVDYLMITPIHYLDNSGQQGIFEYYKEIKERVNLPIIVYNVVPWYTAAPETLFHLRKEGFIDAVKQSGGDIHALGELLSMAKNDMPIMTAIDDMMYPSFILGAVGSICAINTLIPKTSVRLLDYVHKGDYDKALILHEKILPIYKKILKEDMPSRIKFAMNNSGWDVGFARMPILPLTDKEKAELKLISKKVVELENG